MGAYENYLAHHGIKGQKWGVRRYQNPDGTLTAEGRARYLVKQDFGDGKNGYVLSDEAKKEFYDRKGNLSKEGQDIIKNDPDSDLGKALRETEFNNKYDQNMIDSYNKAADVFNSKIAEFNKKWDGIDISDWSSENGQKYLSDIGKLWTDSYGDVLIKDYGEHPYLGKEWINRAFLYSQYDEIKDEYKKA